MPVFSGNVDAAINILVPAKELFAPELERVQHVDGGTVGQGQLVLTEPDPALDGLVVVVVVWVPDEFIDPVHLHGDLITHRNLAAEYGLAKLTIVLWRRGV